MSKNVKVNDKTYNGVSTVELPLASGIGTALFKDVDEITVPSGTKNITANGTYDVSAFASAEVNVPTEGGNGAVEGITECRQIIFTPESGDNGATFSVAHGCSAIPDLILIAINEETETYAQQVRKYVLPCSDKFLTTTGTGTAVLALRTYGNGNTAGDSGPQVSVDKTNVNFRNNVTQRWDANAVYTMWCIVI